MYKILNLLLVKEEAKYYTGNGLFPKIYIKKNFFFHLIFKKQLIFSCQQVLIKWMSCLALNFFVSSKITYDQIFIEAFPKRSNLLLLGLFTWFHLFLKLSLYEVFHWYFSVSWSLLNLLVIIIIKIVTLFLPM